MDTQDAGVQRVKARHSPFAIPPSIRFLMKRLGVYTIVFAVSVVLNFLFPRLMPNDPAQSMIRDIF